MNIIVDTNIVFSAILNPNSNIGLALALAKDCCDFFSPDLLRKEIMKHKSKLLKISKYSEVDFLEIYDYISKHITFVYEEFISESSINYAIDLTKDIDINDTLFVALAIETNSSLWTGDKKLYNGLINKGFRKVISTDEMLQRLWNKIS